MYIVILGATNYMYLLDYLSMYCICIFMWQVIMLILRIYERVLAAFVYMYVVLK